MNVEKVKGAITKTHEELSLVMDAEYAEAKKTGRNLKRLELLGQAAKFLISAEKNVDKAVTPKAKPAPKKK